MFKKYFGDMGFWRVALKLAFPVAMQNLLTSSFILVDTIMVGQYGTPELSAAGFVNNVFNLCLYFQNLILKFSLLCLRVLLAFPVRLSL